MRSRTASNGNGEERGAGIARPDPSVYPTRTSATTQRLVMSFPRKPQRPASLGELLAGSRALGKRAGRVDRDTWLRAVGGRVAARSEPERVHNGELWVKVASSVWSQELSLLAPIIVDRLQAAGVRVTGLRFRVAEVSAAKAPDAGEVVPAPPRAPLPEALKERLQTIEDAELRAAIAEAASYSMGRDTLTSKRGALRAPGSGARGSDPQDRAEGRSRAERKDTGGKGRG